MSLLGMGRNGERKERQIMCDRKKEIEREKRQTDCIPVSWVFNGAVNVQCQIIEQLMNLQKLEQ
jgi:hypothetical protein